MCVVYHQKKESKRGMGRYGGFDGVGVGVWGWRNGENTPKLPSLLNRFGLL